MTHMFISTCWGTPNRLALVSAKALIGEVSQGVWQHAGRYSYVTQIEEAYQHLGWKQTTNEDWEEEVFESCPNLAYVEEAFGYAETNPGLPSSSTP